MDPTDWRSIHDHFLDNTYYRCEFQWRDIHLPNVGVRSRGSGTRNAIKPNLGFDFSRYTSSQRFLGLKSLVTRNFAQDSSMVHEHLAMKLFQRMGLPYERTAHARLYVNEEYVGLYLLVEPVDSRFLQHHFGEDTGYLFEYSWTGEAYNFEYLGEDPSLYVPSPFEPKNHESDPQPEALVEMIRQMNQSRDAEFAHTMERYLDPGAFLTHVAVEQYLAEFDGILGFAGMANFYLYRRTADNRWMFIVWDKDNTFHDWQRDINDNTAENVLVRRALAVPEWRRLYLEAFHEAAQTAGGGSGYLAGEETRVYSLIREAAYADPYKVNTMFAEIVPLSNETFEAAHQYIRDFFRNRTPIVQAAIARDGFTQTPGSLDVYASSATNYAYNCPVLTPGSLARLKIANGPGGGARNWLSITAYARRNQHQHRGQRSAAAFCVPDRGPVSGSLRRTVRSATAHDSQGQCEQPYHSRRYPAEQCRNRRRDPHQLGSGRPQQSRSIRRISHPLCHGPRHG
ncbi:MAG: CotH kinase family protein [Bryobacterales bacterium]|nr:CotH kinase family protein [Bryobacterales bacterium]